MTAAIVCSTVAIARCIASSSSAVFTRRSSFTSADPVRSRSAPKLRARLSVVSAQTRSPIATVSGRAEALGDALEDRDTVVGLVDDDELASGLLPEIERDEHAREDEDGLRAAGEERAGDPAARVGRFAEVRDLPLDPGQVLEIGRRREEEDVDALRLHPFGQPSLPFRVVEHEVRV